MKEQSRFTFCLVALLVVSLVGCVGEGEGQQVADAGVPEVADPPFRNAILVDDALAGGQPTGEELATLAEQGYQTVINLRMPGEDATTAAAAEELGMNYVSLPINGSDGLTEENAVAFAELLGDLDGPAIVHCGSGNRVGAMYALKAFYVDGMSAEEALALGRESGLTSLEGSVREQLRLAEEQPE